MSNRKSENISVSRLQWQCFGRIVVEILAGWLLAFIVWYAMASVSWMNDLYWGIYYWLINHIGYQPTLLLYDYGTRLLMIAFVVMLPLFVLWYNIRRLTRMLEGLLDGVSYQPTLLLYDYGTRLLMIAFVVMLPLFVLWYNIRRLTRMLEGLLDGVSKLAKGLSPEEIALPDGLGEAEWKLRQALQNQRQAMDAARLAEQRKNDLIVYLAHDLKTPLTSVQGYLELLDEQPDIPAEQRRKFIHIAADKAVRLEDYLAHDLKTPLTSVQGYLELLDEQPDIPAEQRRKFIHIAADKAVRLEELINEFFEITRFNLSEVAYQKTNVNLSVLLLQLEEEFYPILEDKQLSISSHIEQDLCITGDADKLARVFDNILRNAVYYSYAGTTIGLRASRLPDGSVEVACTNHGNEIPREKLDLIFEKFYRLDSARGSQSGGAGLGLAIAREIVQRHGGSITAASTPESTCFTVRLSQ